MLNTGSIDDIQIINKKADQTDQIEDMDETEFNLEYVEREHIIKTLRIFNGNISNSAKALGLGRNTLYRKMNKYKIDSTGFEAK
jgi:transcriptional regulator of acetoin/glycerol metabolism